jgi:protein-S-isoprenylcysteine O-methyltransferase Ste14
MSEAFVFVVITIFLVWVSLPSFKIRNSHGFFRFFAWEAILGLLLVNLRKWFVQPLAWHQLISWVLLSLSLVPLTWGIILLRKAGKPSASLETTTQLVNRGIYKWVRHPMYASLLILTLGIFMKSPGWLQGCLAVIACTFLFATARVEERENLAKFGDEYSVYMQKTRMFIPFVW